MKPKLRCIRAKFSLLFFVSAILFTQVINAQSDADNVSKGTNDCSDFTEKENSGGSLKVIDLQNYKYFVSENVTDFVKDLNELGNCGYRLEHLTKAPLKIGQDYNNLNLAAIVKLDKPNKYEYDWFEGFTPGELTTRLNYRAKKGFYLRDSISTIKKSNNPTNSDSTDDVLKALSDIYDILSVTSGKIFFVERKNNAVVDLGDRRVVIGRWGWGKSPTNELQQEFEKTLNFGFSPVTMGFSKILNSYTIFLVMSPNKVNSEVSKGKNFTYRILKSEYGFEKKVNRLAKEGFKILFYDTYGAYGFVIMVKESEDSKPFSYHFLNVTEKNWQDKIKQLSNQGAVYKHLGVAYINSYPDGFEGKLIFEKTQVKKQKQLEYKLLKVSQDFRKSKNHLSFDLMLIPEEMQKETEQILSEGFTLRDLFFADGINILFEKLKE